MRTKANYINLLLAVVLARSVGAAKNLRVARLALHKLYGLWFTSSAKRAWVPEGFLPPRGVPILPLTIIYTQSKITD